MSWIFYQIPIYFYEKHTGQKQRIYILILGIKGFAPLLLCFRVRHCVHHC